MVLGLSLSWPALVSAAQLTPFLRQQRIGVLVENVRLPAGFSKDLTSGLTSRILMQLTLLQAGAPVASKVVDIAFKYDLWEETFSMTMAVDGVTTESRTLAKADEVLATLARVSFPALFATDRLDRSKAFAVAVRVLFNPVERERLEEIRKWVAENSRPAAADPQNATSLTAPPPVTESRSLFNRIFEQYAAGAAVAAAFSDSATSKPFELQGLRESAGP